jgi:hypothetical protein
MSHKRSTVTVLSVLLALIVPAAAAAHEGNPNFRSEITAFAPAAAAEGLSATIQNFDDNVEMVNRTGKAVLVEGYEGEPYVRFSADGTVEVNLNSPSYYLNEDRFAEVEVPDRADPDAEPEWEVLREDGIYSWHDHRSHYMAEGTPPQVKDESEKTKVFDYSIPLRVDGRPVEMNGTLTWVGQDSGFPVLPFAGLVVLILLGAAGLAVMRSRRTDDGQDEERHDRDRPDSGGKPDGRPEAW